MSTVAKVNDENNREELFKIALSSKHGYLQIIKFVKNLILFFIVLIAFFYCLDLLFTTVFTKGDFLKNQWLYNMKEVKYDYAVFGNSRAYTTIDVGHINNKSGLKGINLSIDGSYISSQALMLELFLAHDNHIKTLYLNVDGFHINLEEESEFCTPRFLPYIKDKIVFDHYKEMGVKWYAYRYVPFIRYAEYNFEWGVHILFNNLFKTFKPEYDHNGSFFIPFSNYYGGKEKEDYLFDVNAETKYLDKIISLCQKFNVELITFTAPSANVRTDERYYNSIEAFTKLMQEKGIKYYNFGDIYNGKYELFTDERHLNKAGVEKFSDEILALVRLSNDLAYK